MILELYTGNRLTRKRLGRVKTEEDSLEVAMTQARSLMRNVRFDGKAVTFCRIKDGLNHILCEVKAEG